MLLVVFVLAPPGCLRGEPSRGGRVRWEHLSSARGELPVPVAGGQQTASLVLDVDGDGVQDIVIAERTGSPSLVWLRRRRDGWERHVVDGERLRIEAGGACGDLDGDGDLDLVFGNDASGRNVWWWENPRPEYGPGKSWRRRLIKDSGGTKHHDEVLGDADGDGRAELVFWNQGARSLCLAEVPLDPRKTEPWPYRVIYSWREDREHEGLALADIDADGMLDLAGGGSWYRHEGEGRFAAGEIDGSMRFTRAAAGQLVVGGWAEVVFVPGDADGPLRWYAREGGRWAGRTLEPEVRHGHSLALGDVDRDGHLDIFVAEMGRWGGGENREARMLVFFGDGAGGFERSVVAAGFGNHESRLADLDGDGDLDILGKPYSWEAPRLDVWLGGGTGKGSGGG